MVEAVSLTLFSPPCARRKAVPHKVGSAYALAALCAGLAAPLS
jgi:hypothetical protein